MLIASCQPSATPADDVTDPSQTAAESTEKSPVAEVGEKTETVSEASEETGNAVTIPDELLVDVNDLDGVEIRFWHPWVDEMDQIVQDLVIEFNQSNKWGILVDAVSPGSSGEVYEQIRVATEKEGEKSMMEGAGVSPSSGKAYLHATGTLDYGLPPNVFVAPIDHMLSLEEKDISVVDLSNYVHYPELGFTDQDRADFPASFWSNAMVDEKLYGIPAESVANALFYNVTWADELGFSKPPTTIDEFKKQVCAAADANNEIARNEGAVNAEDFMWDDQLRKVGTGGWIINMNTPVTLSWMKAFGDADIPADHDGLYHFDNDETLEAFQFIQELYDEGCAWTSRNPDPYEYFVNRQALFYSGSMPDILIQDRIFTMSVLPEEEEDNEGVEEAGVEEADKNIELPPTDEWTVIPYPTTNGNPEILVNNLSYGMLESTPEEQLAGWLFIRWMSQPENVARLVKGNGTIPVRVSANNLLKDYAEEYPQWGKTLGWVPMTFNTPALSTWRIAGNILQDGAWHIFESTLPADQISEILAQMDEMIPEVEEEMEY